MALIRAVVTGVSGRMGSLLVRLVREARDFELVGFDAGQSLEQTLASNQADVVIDFTAAEASVAHAKICAHHGVKLVIGSTGFTAEQRAQLKDEAQKVAILESPNMSVGVNVVVAMAAQLARQLGEDFDIEVLETHHRQKKDAPSGTANRLAEVLAQATSRPSSVIRQARVGQVGERPAGEIGVQALRGGDVVGEHTVFFFGDGERVELTHRATSREQFGRGALRAARWLYTQGPGLYSMADALRAEVANGS